MENKTQVYCYIEEVVIYYKCIYFNAIDTITACIQDRFNQLGFRTCESINQLLLNAVNDKNYEEQLKTVWRQFIHNNISYSACITKS